MWYYLFKYVLLGPLLRVLGRPEVEGLENLPERGPAILASNHLAVMDSFFLPLMVPRRIYFLAKAEYFNGTGIKGRFQAWFYTAVGQVPIDRSDSEAAQAALERVRGGRPRRGWGTTRASCRRSWCAGKPMPMRSRRSWARPGIRRRR